MPFSWKHIRNSLRQIRCQDIEVNSGAGQSITNALLLNIDGTATQALYIDDDGTLTTAIRIDGSPSGGAIDMSNLTDEAGQCNIILGGAGRISTSTAAGALLNIDATTYQWTQALELRYAVTDWADTYTLTEFTGLYLRVENQEANASGSIYGMQLYGVSNNVANTQYLWGALIYAYVKGAAGLTTSGIYALQPEITFDAATASSTVTDAAIVRAKLTGGTMSDYTVLDGYRLTLGDMNGGSRKYGNGLLLEDDSGMSGTCTLTTGINISIGCTTAMNIGTCTDGIIFTGTVTEKCIDFGQVTLTGDSCNNAWSYGDGDGAVTKVIADYFFVTRINYASTTNPGSEVLTSCAFNKISVTTAHQANLDIQGIGMTIDIGKNVGYAHGIDVVVDVTASATTTTGSTYGGKFSLDFSSGTTMTYPSTGYHGAAVFAQVTGTGTYSGASVNIIHARKSGATTVQAALDIESQTGATITSGIHLRGDGNITNAIEFEDQDGSNGAKVVQATMDGDVADALVRIDINGTAYYIPAFNAAGITGEF
jgi:hypothetical protein